MGARGRFGRGRGPGEPVSLEDEALRAQIEHERRARWRASAPGSARVPLHALRDLEATRYVIALWISWATARDPRYGFHFWPGSLAWDGKKTIPSPPPYTRGDGSGKLDEPTRHDLMIHGFHPLFGRASGYFTKGPNPCPGWGSIKYQPVCPECGWHACDRDPWIGGHRMTCSRYIAVRECSDTCRGSRCPDCKGALRHP